MTCGRRLTVACLAGALLFSGAAGAHTRSVSYSFWTLTEHGAEVRARIAQLELTRAGLAPEGASYLQRAAQLLIDSLQLQDATGACRTSADLPPVLRDGQVLHAWRVECSGSPEQVSSHLARRLGADHSHFLTVYTSGDAPPVTRVLTARDNNWSAQAAEEAANTPVGIAGFLRLGFEHILSGWDHLLFLLALVALAVSLRELAWLATGFTLGHSLTLALAVLGLARPAPTAVEALIALSIVGLALENGWRLDRRSAGVALVALPLLLLLGWAADTLPLLVVLGLALFMATYGGLLKTGAAGFRARLALTAAFGLFHGFGFSGVLAGMQLAPGQTAQALLGFNLGVEAGQLLLLALVWPLLRAMQRRDWPAPQTISAAAAGIGVWVYLLRVF